MEAGVLRGDMLFYVSVLLPLFRPFPTLPGRVVGSPVGVLPEYEGKSFVRSINVCILTTGFFLSFISFFMYIGVYRVSSTSVNEDICSSPYGHLCSLRVRSVFLSFGFRTHPKRPDDYRLYGWRRYSSGVNFLDNTSLGHSVQNDVCPKDKR